jgi:hypothetical protein
MKITSENVVPYAATVVKQFPLWFNYADYFRNQILKSACVGTFSLNINYWLILKFKYMLTTGTSTNAQRKLVTLYNTDNA